jgi:hypothetical protein
LFGKTGVPENRKTVFRAPEDSADAESWDAGHYEHPE